MKPRLIVLAATFAILAYAIHYSESGEKKDNPAKMEGNKLEGPTWVEVHAFAKEKPKGQGSVYLWRFFKGDKVLLYRHNETLNGELLAYHAGTYKVDVSGKVMAIDIILKSAFEGDLKYFAIYRFDGGKLMLSMSKEKRPTTFEDKEDNRLFVLQPLPYRK